MKTEFKILAGFLAVILLSCNVIACNVYCNDCDSCVAAITNASAGETICLSQDIVNHSGSCINDPA